MKWFWHLHREWTKRAEEARDEVEQSREDLERSREQIVRPLAEWRKQNHFAQLIHDSLLDGKGDRNVAG